MSSQVLLVDGEQARSGPKPRPWVAVAVGILINRQRQFLLTSRPPGKAYAGYWEFPGGKLEIGEGVEQALRRELQEEIGVLVGQVHPWKTSLVDYPHALVRLNFCKVFDWTGQLFMREGQSFSWERTPVSCAPILPGTVPVLQWLNDEALG